MNKWISIPIIVVLVAALTVSLVLYFQESNNLEAAEAEIVDLEGDILFLEENVSTLEEDVITLEIDLGVAEVEISILESDIEDKEVEISTLQSNLAEAEVEISTLQSDLESKEAEIAVLEADLAAAEVEVLRLEGELATAQGDITRLEGELAAAQAEAASLTQALAQAQEEKTALETQISEWESAYTRISNEIIKKFGIGADAMEFVTPNDDMVINLATSIAGTFSQDWGEVWRDYRNLYFWVRDNITYNYDTPLPVLPLTPSGTIYWLEEYWRMPRETIEAGVGDCEDMALLLSSMILNYSNEQYKIWTIGIMSENGGHMAVAIPVVGGRLVILDPAGLFFTSNGGYIDTTKSITQAINDWLQYWSYQMPNVYVDFVFDNQFYETFNSTSEFIAWAVTQ